MTPKTKPCKNVSYAVKKAIRQLGESKGSSFKDIKKYIVALYENKADVPDSKSIRQYLKSAVDKGILWQLDNGNYKLKETARYRNSPSGNCSMEKSVSRSRSKKIPDGTRHSLTGSKKYVRPNSRKLVAGSKKKAKQPKKKPRLIKKRPVTPASGVKKRRKRLSSVPQKRTVKRRKMSDVIPLIAFRDESDFENPYMMNCTYFS